MQAVGNEVFVAIGIPIVAIALLIATNWKDIKQVIAFQFAADVRINQNQQQRERRQQHHNDQVCSICLAQPKNIPVASTCGHSFCAECILSLYERLHNKIKCPLCRQQVTILFKLFQSSPLTLNIEQQMRQYNRRFDDNRPFIRRLIQLPYVLVRIKDFIWRPQFIIYFLRSVHLFRLFFLIIVYVLMPFDLIPQSLLGVIGYIDDFLFIMLLLSFFMAIAAIQYIRHRE